MVILFEFKETQRTSEMRKSELSRTAVFVSDGRNSSLSIDSILSGSEFASSGNKKALIKRIKRK